MAYYMGSESGMVNTVRLLVDSSSAEVLRAVLRVDVFHNFHIFEVRGSSNGDERLDILSGEVSLFALDDDSLFSASAFSG